MRHDPTARSVIVEPHCHNPILSLHPDSAAPRFELVRLTAGSLVYGRGDRIHHVYFPVSAVISLTVLMANGATIEIASVGNEGLVGLPVVMGSTTMPSRAEVRTTGLAYRVRASELQRDFNTLPVMRTAILEYAQTLLTQVSQLSACHRHHSLGQQVTRWILAELDRAKSDEIGVTHQSLAHMLGVCRERVTEASRSLTQAGIISNTRAHIGLLDRPRLAATCCECYGIVNGAFTRLHQRTQQLARTGTIWAETEESAQRMVDT